MLAIADSMGEVAPPKKNQQEEAEVAPRAPGGERAQGADRRRRRRLGRAGHRRLLRRAGPRGRGDRHRRGEGRGAAPRRADDPRAGPPELLARNADRLTFTTDHRRALDAARLLFCCVDTPPTYSGDADLSRVRAVVDAARRRRRARAGDEEHGPRRDGPRDPPRPPRARLRLLPRVPQGGLGGRRLPAPRPGRDRRRPGRRVGGRRGRRRSTSRSAASSSAPTSPAPR